MNRARAIWLVARRELLERGRSKGFLASLILTEVFVIGSLLLQASLGAGENRLVVGYVGDPPLGFHTYVQVSAESLGGSVEVVPLPDRAAAEAALREELVNGAYIPGASPSDPGVVLFKEGRDERVYQVVQSAILQMRLAEADVQLIPHASTRSNPSRPRTTPRSCSRTWASSSCSSRSSRSATGSCPGSSRRSRAGSSRSSWRPSGRATC